MRAPGRLILVLLLLLGASAAHAAGPKGEMRIVLEQHNRLRARHCAPPLVWSRQLAAFAQAWASRLAKKGCRLEHRAKSRYGENLAAGTDVIMGPAHAVNGWYREVARYRFGRGGFSFSTGHFTQLVWLASRRLGCGTARCGEIRLWVCNYDPPGNVQGQYAQNVKPAKCRK